MLVESRGHGITTCTCVPDHLVAYNTDITLSKITEVCCAISSSESYKKRTLDGKRSYAPCLLSGVNQNVCTMDCILATLVFMFAISTGTSCYGVT